MGIAKKTRRQSLNIDKKNSEFIRESPLSNVSLESFFLGGGGRGPFYGSGRGKIVRKYIQSGVMKLFLILFLIIFLFFTCTGMYYSEGSVKCTVTWIGRYLLVPNVIWRQSHSIRLISEILTFYFKKSENLSEMAN